MSLGDTKAVMVCVDFSDVLSVTLPFNRSQFESILVVTHPDDKKTISVANQFGADVLLTTVFYEKGAVFNKFHAIELGLERNGRSGSLAILDCDVLFPRNMRPWIKRLGCLYTPRRRMFPTIPQSVDLIPEERKWRQYKYRMPREPFDGYCQIFHASDPILGSAPWHITNWKWCAGPDTFFHRNWNERNKVRPNFEVLHLGEPATNWAGRVTPYADGTVPENAEKNRDMVNVFLRSRLDPNRLKDKYENERISEDVHPSPV
jgi:hypothetical protein